MSKTLAKIATLERTNLIPQDIEEKINKLLSVKRTSQWYLLGLTDQDCNEIQNVLSVIQQRINTNSQTIRRVESVRHEAISILFQDEDFI